MVEPPHMRGKGSEPGTGSLQRRITPAWAGKRPLPSSGDTREWDHPRMGGEKYQSMAHRVRVTGSPPHGRGKVCARIRIAPVRGITPAWAGKSDSPPVCGWVWEDHPRVGGEKPRPYNPGRCPAGSPPHGRGKADPRRHRTRQAGITPAWAGKNPASQPWSPPLWIMVIRPRP